MQYVEPIKNIDDIKAIKHILMQSSHRDLLLFVLGINTGVRVNDLLFLKVQDLWDGKKVKEFLLLKESHLEEKEVKSYYINNSVQVELEKYLSQSEINMNDYLFKSKKNNQPISRQQAYRIINQAAKQVGIKGKIGTHTLRKTFGYHAFRKGIAISIIMNIFNHHSPSETLRYIGIDNNEDSFIRVDVNL